MKESANKGLDVYFNSACPICKAGINAQKEKSIACVIEWKDIHEDESLVSDLNKNLSTVRKYLHVTDENNEQYIGINAFIQLWENSPKERWKAHLFSLPIIRQLAQTAYILFANCLYSWNVWKKNW